MSKSALKVFSDKSESLNYNIPEFPLYIRTGKLEYFDNYQAENHWHFDLEYLLVLSGEIDYFVNGSCVTLKSGQCIFVNSKRMHYGFSTTHTKCTFIAVAIHPSLFIDDKHFIKTYWSSKFNDSMENYRMITSEQATGKRIIKNILTLNEQVTKKQTNPFQFLSLAAELVYLIGEQLHPISTQNHHELSWNYFSNMIEFIYKNYEQKILLSDIAAAGQVCRSNCYNFFKDYANTTPIDFLNQYRLKKSLELLKDTKRSITEIAVSCGFQTSSYYTYNFRTEMGITPKEYRKSLPHL